MTWSGKGARDKADAGFGAAEPGSAVTSCDATESHWIEIELLGEDGKPVPDVAYRIELTDGSVVEGKLDDRGRAHVGEIASPGNCIVTFLELDQDAWDAA